MGLLHRADRRWGAPESTSNGASDKLSLRLQSAVPTVLEVDVGDNGTADASFDRNLFTAIAVSAGSGNDRVTSTR